MSTRVPTHAPQLIVRRLSASALTGLVQFGNLTFPCALGRSGISARKREGDGATPRGRLALRQVLYKAQAVARPITGLPVRSIAKSDGWCDAPQDRNYNRPVRLPYPASAERMWREDGVYDLVLVLDYNIMPRKRGSGSAIFMHVVRPGFLPTEGCVALRRSDLQRLLASVRPGTELISEA